MRFAHADGRWWPHGTERTDRPKVGDLVAFRFAAWRVMHVRTNDPSDEEAARLTTLRPEYRERQLGYSLTLRREHGPACEHENSRKEIALKLPALSYYRWDAYSGDRVPLCSCCGHPWPCRMLVAEEQAERSAEILAGRMARVMPGICYGCGEVITSRQGSVSMPEGNVDIPGYPAPRFHTRRSCAAELNAYLSRRKRALPDAPEALPTTTKEQP